MPEQDDTHDEEEGRAGEDRCEHGERLDGDEDDEGGGGERGQPTVVPHPSDHRVTAGDDEVGRDREEGAQPRAGRQVARGRRCR